MTVTTNNGYFREQHELVGLCNAEETVFSEEYEIILKHYWMESRMQLGWPHQVSL